MSAKELSMIFNSEKILLRDIANTCFQRCVVDSRGFEKEYLNPLEMNCIDRCTSKYDQVVRVMESVNAKAAQR